MSDRWKVLAFVAGLVAVLGAAFAVGRSVSGDAAPVATSYRLSWVESPTAPGTSTLRFRIEDARGTTVTRFATRHEKELHLVAVDTGYAGYQHLHPTMAADGTWSVRFDAAAGTTRVYADFQPAGAQNAVATAQLRLPGPLGSPSRVPGRVQTVDGYTVTAVGAFTAGQMSVLRFEISHAGLPVRDLQPYLGAYGHLVSLRDTDGRYLHVHPQDGPPGPMIPFHIEVPTAGTYHLYLDFRRGGVVRTVHFVLDAAATALSGGDPGGMGGMGGMDHGDH